ncbi:MAG: OsmC family protein [Anaerolineae bacterium]|nr:OsmC family protein [Anaerolineae bacterium]
MEFQLTVNLPNEDGYVDVRVGEHTIRASTRHDGKAPSPGEIFLVGLAACVGGNVINYCALHNCASPTEITMTANFNLDTQMTEKVIFEIHLPSNFPEKHLKTIERVIDTCDVKQAWKQAPEFESIIVRS